MFKRWLRSLRTFSPTPSNASPLTSLRWLMVSYVGLISLDLLHIAGMTLERCLYVLWLAYLWLWWPRRHAWTLPPGQLGLTSVMVHAPALMMGGVALADAMSGYDNEWASGLLEVWMLPALPWLELLPPWQVDGISGLFIATCWFAPAVTAVTVLIWLVTMPQARPSVSRHAHLAASNAYALPTGRVRARSSSKRQKAR
ncbi:MAG: hypothetical protein K6T30_10440 [Alicyclobacillus sp.]|nr:hypothetical protein [Alicyclobacillus sp.]